MKSQFRSDFKQTSFILNGSFPNLDSVKGVCDFLLNSHFFKMSKNFDLDFCF